MILRKFGAVGVCLGLAVLPLPSQARPVGTVTGMPFFGVPYPYGYVYHRPRMECYTSVWSYDPLQGPRIDVIWICGAPVTAKY